MRVAPQPRKPTKIFLLADQSADLTYFFSSFNHSLGEEFNSLRFQICTHTSLDFQFFIFPKNRQSKPYCDVYLSILPSPDLIIYIVEAQAPIKEIVEWLNLFDKDYPSKIIFFSSARTYLQRQQVLIKLSSLFAENVGNHVFFPNIGQQSFQKCMKDLEKVGISMKKYVRLMPSISKLKWLWKKIKNWTKSRHNDSGI